MMRSPNCLLGVVLGSGYLLIGVVGLCLTSSLGFVVPNGPKLCGLFEINTLSNVAHLVIASALLIAALSGVRAARRVNVTVGGVYLVVAIAGLANGGANGALDFLAVNNADNFLHLTTAVLLLIVAIGADWVPRRPTTA